MLRDEITKHVEAGAIGQLIKFLLCKHGHLGSIPSTCVEEEEEEVLAPWWQQLGCGGIYYLRAKDTETGRSLRLSGQPA